MSDCTPPPPELIPIAPPFDHPQALGAGYGQWVWPEPYGMVIWLETGLWAPERIMPRGRWYDFVPGAGWEQFGYMALRGEIDPPDVPITP